MHVEEGNRFLMSGKVRFRPLLLSVVFGVHEPISMYVVVVVVRVLFVGADTVAIVACWRMDPFLLPLLPQKRMGKKTSNYLVCMDLKASDRVSPLLLGKLRSNWVRVCIGDQVCRRFPGYY